MDVTGPRLARLARFTTFLFHTDSWDLKEIPGKASEIGHSNHLTGGLLPVPLFPNALK